MLFIASFVGIYLIRSFNPTFPYSDRILIFTKVPQWIWGFGNFDGVHYLRIARYGYIDDFAQAFFPLFPILIRYVTKYNFLLPIETAIKFPQYIEAQYFQNALIISNLLFFIGIIFLYKLLRIDHKKSVSFKSIFFLLAFPTAFYFGAVYSESMFFLLTVLTFYFMRKNKFIISGIFAALASGTRVIGVILFFSLLIEVMVKRKNIFKKPIEIIKMLLSLVIAPSGLVIFMIYLKLNFNDYLYFLNAQPLFGADRTNTPIITLPQVFFRYAKMLITLEPVSYQYFTILLELVFTIVALLLVIFSFKKVRMSYFVFSILAFLFPTLTGTFSSMPRYVLMLFLLIPLVVVKANKRLYNILIITFLAFECFLVILFTRGMWVS